MLISEFSRATGLTPDTIRFYVRRGLLDPQVGVKGGRNPYQLFDAKHVQVAELIRIGQALGLSLGEIGSLLDDSRNGRLSRERRLALMVAHRNRLRSRAGQLMAMAEYLDAKFDWTKQGEIGEQPQFSAFVPTKNKNFSQT
jgi:MerR family copper efflux transcriptional regulator